MTPEPTLVATLVAGIGATTTAIGYLHKKLMAKVEAQHQEVQGALEAAHEERKACQEDREMLWSVLAKQAGTLVDDLKKRA